MITQRSSKEALIWKEKKRNMNNVERYIQAYKNKIANKVFGIVSLYTHKNRKGVVLLSFLNGPFTLSPREYFTDPHSNYWVVMEIARLLLKRGYDVDCINWDNAQFIPKKKYVACIDLHRNLERLHSFLGKDCIKIMHLESSYVSSLNAAEQTRLEALRKRKGAVLTSKRSMENSDNPEYADFLAGYGNETTRDTYRAFNKKVTPIPVPTMEIYDFPENKDFSAARKHFLWFGGGGAILKGLDLVVEAFASLPHLQLSIIGPAAFEKEFEELYAKELALPNITRYGRPRINEKGENLVDGKDIREIYDQCGAIIFLSASEGGGGATVQAMQAGLYPIVTPNTSIDERAPSTIMEDLSIENIKKVVEDFSNLPQEEVARRAKDSWTFAREHHTKEAFTKAYENFLDNVVKLQ